MIDEHTPPDAAAILGAMARHYVSSIDLGTYNCSHNERLSLCELRHEADPPAGIRKEHAMSIAVTGGGEEVLFLGWADGETHLFYADMEAEGPDEVFRSYGPFNAGIRELHQREQESCEDDPDLLTFFDEVFTLAKQIKTARRS
jgi:hypothetical protein